MLVICKPFLMTAAMFAFAAVAEAAIIYEWVDDAGRVHISDVVPKKYEGSAKRFDSSQFNLSPEERKAAQARAAALKAQAGQSAPGTTPAAPRPAVPGSAASSPARRPVADFSDCSAWRRAFNESQDCFAGYQTQRGALRPGAYEACGPEIPNPEPKCGPERQ